MAGATQSVQREVRGGPAGPGMDPAGARHFEESGHRHVADRVEGSATEGADLAAGDPDRGREHRLDDDAGGECGRSVLACRTPQQGTQNGIDLLVGQATTAGLECSEQLRQAEGAHPGIGHDVGHGGHGVGQAIGHQPVGHGRADVGLTAQRCPFRVQAVKDPADGAGGALYVEHGTSPFGSRAVNSPQLGLPECLPSSPKEQVMGLPMWRASLGGRLGKPVVGVGKPAVTGRCNSRQASAGVGNPVVSGA